MAVWAIAISDWFTRGTNDAFGPDSKASAPTLPFSGVAKLCLWIHGNRWADWSVVVWALVASALYAVAAALLLLAAMVTTNIRSRRHNQK
jgi:hypothetical protein